MYGTDVSEHNDLVQTQFDKLRAGGIEFCVVRASVGTTPDNKALLYSQRAGRAGMVVGAYHFLRPDRSPIDQAQLFGDVASQMPDVNFVALDVEEAGLTQQDVAIFTSHFRKEFESPSLGLYTNPSTLSNLSAVRNLFDWHWIARYDSDVSFWLSDIATQPLENPPEVFWQFSEKMKFRDAGTTEVVDADWFDGNMLRFLKYVDAIS